MPGIDAIVTDHFEMFFRDMLGKPGYEIKDRDGFRDQFFIFMPMIMKGNKFAIIRINVGGCDHRASEITANVLDHVRWITFVG